MFSQRVNKLALNSSDHKRQHLNNIESEPWSKIVFDFYMLYARQFWFVFDFILGFDAYVRQIQTV